MNRDQRINEILGAEEQEIDKSLRGRAWERACDGRLPRTLTPHEWEEWYRENGVPKQHRRAGRQHADSWWRRWLRLNR